MEEITIQQPLCSECSTEIITASKFCANCGFPENGDEKEKAVFHAKKVMKKNEIMDDHKKINSARNTLYWMAGIFFVFGLFYFFTTEDVGVLIVNTILSAIYLVLAFWSQKKPFAAILSALFLYVTVIVLNAIEEPLTLVQGILFKIIIFSFLIKGLYSAPRSKKE